MSAAPELPSPIPEHCSVWIDGQITSGAEARIPVFDHGLLYGDGLFEALRINSGRVFRMEKHLARLAAGAKAMGIELPGGLEGMQQVVLETARAHAEPDAYVRLIVTRGDGGLGVDPSSCPRPRVICIVGRIQLYPAEKLVRGIDLVTVSLRRPPADSLDPRVKSLNYLTNVLSRREATLRGADEALVLNHDGLVAEASVANVFAVLSGELVTPPATQGALEGITRGALLELAKEHGIACSERPIGRFDLFAADEVFLSGTAARVVPVATLDGQAIGSESATGARPVTTQLAKALAQLGESTGVAF
jgi:branched-chain amino acid aminotransferase